MSSLRKDGYLYMYTGELNNDEITKLIREGIDEYLKDSPRPYEVIVNAVEDREFKKMGFSYGWISDRGLYNALLGKNEDGSSRVTIEDDPDWEEPEDSEPDLTLGGANWGDMAVWDDCPKIRIENPPLITIKPYLDKDKEEHTIDFFEAVVKYKSGLRNEIYSTNIPKIISEKYLHRIFDRFGTDQTVHIQKDKRTKERKSITYPLIRVNEKDGKRNCQIVFSPLDKDLAQFALLMTKKLRYGKNKSDIIFFSQSKK